MVFGGKALTEEAQCSGFGTLGKPRPLSGPWFPLLQSSDHHPSVWMAGREGHLQLCKLWGGRREPAGVARGHRDDAAVKDGPAVPGTVLCVCDCCVTPTLCQTCFQTAFC